MRRRVRIGARLLRRLRRRSRWRRIGPIGLEWRGRARRRLRPSILLRGGGLRLGMLRPLRMLRRRGRRLSRLGRRGGERVVGPVRRLEVRHRPHRPLVGLEPKIDGLGRRHDRNVGDRLRPELDDSRLDLRIDAPEQRPDVEIEHRAIAVDHAAGLGPWRQRIERALLERLHHLDPRGEPRGEVGFRYAARRPEVPKQLRYLSVIAGRHLFNPVNVQTLSRGKIRRRTYRHLARFGRHSKAGPIFC